MVLEKTLENPLDCKIKMANPKKKRKTNKTPEFSLEGLMLNLKLLILWPPVVKRRLIGKDPGDGKE